MNPYAKFLAVMTIAMAATPALADSCSGRSHDTGTILGAGAGAAVVGLASHSLVGAVVGGVAGGLAGNAIARNSDCRHVRRVRHARTAYTTDRDGHRHYYRR